MLITNTAGHKADAFVDEEYSHKQPSEWVWTEKRFNYGSERI